MLSIRKWRILTIIAFSLFWLTVSGCGQQKTTFPPGGPPEVAVIKVKKEVTPITIELTGRTVPAQISEVRPQVNGIIQKRLFTEGSDVKKGQALYQIDPAPYQATLDNAEAALQRAEANLPAVRSRVERFKELLASRAVSQQDYDDAAAALKQIESDIQYWRAMVRTAKINLGYTLVTAPISGRIGKSNVTEGALVTAHQPVPLATIQTLDPMYVDVPQSTTEMLRLQRVIGDAAQKDASSSRKVTLILEDGNTYPWSGKLQFRDITVEPTTGSIVLRIIFPNPQGILLPGMFVRAIVQEGLNKNAILVPQQAVQRTHKGDPYVFVVDAERKVQVRPLSLERAVGDKWLVSSGLNVGDEVIVEGIQRIKPGVPVKVSSWESEKITGNPPDRTK